MGYPPMSGFTSSAFVAGEPAETCALTISKLSSAHVYLRQPDGQPHGPWDKLPKALVDDAAQLVKANSIEGSL